MPLPHFLFMLIMVIAAAGLSILALAGSHLPLGLVAFILIFGAAGIRMVWRED